MKPNIIIGLILIAIGVIFSLNNKDIAKGAASFYKKLYTKENLTVMFKAAGIILIVGGVIVLVK